MPLPSPHGRSLDVNKNVASKSTEVFTAHPKTHPLMQNPCQFQIIVIQTNPTALHQQEHMYVAAVAYLNR
jgi:hypothetical protein